MKEELESRAIELLQPSCLNHSGDLPQIWRKSTQKTKFGGEERSAAEKKMTVFFEEKISKDIASTFYTEKVFIALKLSKF